MHLSFARTCVRVCVCVYVCQVLLTAGGQVYTAGANKFGECGVGFCSPNVDTLSRVRGIGGMLIVDVFISKGATFDRRRSSAPAADPDAGADDHDVSFTFTTPDAMRQIARRAMANLANFSMPPSASSSQLDPAFYPQLSNRQSLPNAVCVCVCVCVCLCVRACRG